ncbi:hypothetical protein [Streptomyces sp. NPDC050548]|uniref:hypothetical protein n=1 Tax=Streptomyces sp. NPDC050548 TaxID=3365629 RepID=UPI0037AB68A5
MGVFERLLRKSKSTEEASTAGTETAEDRTAGAADEVSETEAGAGVQEAARTTATEAVGAADGVEIPKQQSAEEAADNEAGEGART